MSESEQNSEARYSIGIDLGTTHSVRSYGDRAARRAVALAGQGLAGPGVLAARAAPAIPPSVSSRSPQGIA